jgi:hypothetical protein
MTQFPFQACSEALRYCPAQAARFLRDTLKQQAARAAGEASGIKEGQRLEVGRCGWSTTFVYFDHSPVYGSVWKDAA